ncbi:MAG: ABC transporter permease [Melioribacteraceae bacterium]|nr:ABC transporter permease [Melioribacteraceae bacterium]
MKINSLNYSRIFRSVFFRFINSFIVLFLLATFIFFMIRLAPGDPTQKFVSAEASPALIENLKKSYGINDSLSEQYLNFLQETLSLNFGYSFSYRTPVIDVIKPAFSFTAFFAAIVFVFQFGLGLILALFITNTSNSKIEKVADNLGILLFSIPSFVIALFLLQIFSVKLGILPQGGLKSYDFHSFGLLNKFFDYTSHLILPIVTLSFAGIALFYKYFKDSLKANYQTDYVLFLRSIGTKEKSILRDHVLPNSIIPSISIAGITLGLLFNGALITEYIFELPGMGRLTMNAIFARDYPLVMGTTFVAGFCVIVINFLADLLKILFNPQYSETSLN